MTHDFPLRRAVVPRCMAQLVARMEVLNAAHLLAQSDVPVTTLREAVRALKTLTPKEQSCPTA